MAANSVSIDALAINQTTNRLADRSALVPPSEQAKNLSEGSADNFVAPEQMALSTNVKGAIFESENYKFRETSTLESMTFALICIGAIALMAARRFKRAFI
jgi:hypothetical protein